MDSKAINKLIRSEIWPLLRQFGFTHFEARRAFAYRQHFISVVAFQSFNSHLADGLGCTTYSFAVRLGVYVVGQPGGNRTQRDKDGRLRPQEYECVFRSELLKRTPVDGFDRNDVFYIDPDGNTVGPCFNELQHLVHDVLPGWFAEHNDLQKLIDRENGFTESERLLPYNDESRRTLLLLLQHNESPSEQSAAQALSSLERMIGVVLGYSTIQSGRPGEERYVLNVRALWDQLGAFRPTVHCGGGTPRGSLESAVWDIAVQYGFEPLQSIAGEEPISARKQLWPMLREMGFSEFTDRLAHRISKDFVEVVEFLPMDPYERKHGNHPSGLFRIGVGLFWNGLLNHFFRTDRKGEPRPIVNECHLSYWLSPDMPSGYLTGTAFNSVEKAIAGIRQDGLPWLERFRDPASAMAMFERADWELFACYPMMRGYGAKRSSLRLIYLAQLSSLLGHAKEVERHLVDAEDALNIRPMQHFKDRYRDWIESVRGRLLPEG